MRPLGECGDVAEWSKALAWKVSIRQKRIEGSNPSVSARFSNTAMACGELVVLPIFLQELDADCLAPKSSPPPSKNLANDTPPHWPLG